MFALTDRSRSEPHFLKQPRRTTAVVGDNVVLECAASPVTSFLWTKDNVGHNFKGSQLLGKGNLHFPSVQKFHEGNYKCQAVFEVSNTLKHFNDSEVVMLTVLGKKFLLYFVKYQG